MMEAELKCFEELKKYLNLGIDRAYSAAEGHGIPRSESWCDLAITVKAHGYYSMVAADKALKTEGWVELIDETIERLAPLAVV